MIVFESIREPIAFRDALALQHARVEARARDEIADTVIFCEHQPVVTRGRGLQRKAGRGGDEARAMPLELDRLPPGFDYQECERGGDLTVHSPGQLVVYPIFKLDGSSAFARTRDLESYLRRLERVVIEYLGSLGLRAHAVPDASGVWIDHRKIASLGIAVRKWVTYHGIALNVVNDLSAFFSISPCGFSPEVMTRLEDELPRGAVQTGEHWRREAEFALIRLFAAAHTRPLPPATPPATT